MNEVLIEAAIENNVSWCDTVVKTHGRKTRRTEHVWIHDGKSVPYYPRLITTAHATTSVHIESTLAQLGSDVDGITIKDSRAELDLDRTRFQVLFESQWIALRTDSKIQAEVTTEAVWSTVSSGDELRRWRSRWAQFSRTSDEFAQELFNEELANRPQVGFLWRFSNETVVGIAISYDDSNTIGISNCMSEEPFRDSNWRSLASYLQNRSSASFLVGYENGLDLEAARKAGFMNVGNLRVWNESDSSREERR